MDTIKELSILIIEDKISGVKWLKAILDSPNFIIPKNRLKVSIARDVINQRTNFIGHPGFFTAERLLLATKFDLVFMDQYFEEEEELRLMKKEKQAEFVFNLVMKHNPNCSVLVFTQDAGSINPMGGEANFGEKRIPKFSKNVRDPNKTEKTPDIQKYNIFVRRGLVTWLKKVIMSLSPNNRQICTAFLRAKSLGNSSLNTHPKAFDVMNIFFFLDHQEEWRELFEELKSFLYDIPSVQSDTMTKNNKCFGLPASQYYYEYYSSPRTSFSITEVVRVSMEKLGEICDELFNFLGAGGGRDQSSSDEIQRIRADVQLFDSPLNLFTYWDEPEHGIKSPHLENFHNRLIARMVTLGMYFAMNFSASGIKFYLKNKSDADTENCHKQFASYLLISMGDQCSTDSDHLFMDFCDSDKNRIKLDESDRPIHIKPLVPRKRNYVKMFGQMARYEQEEILKFVEKINEKLSNKKDEPNFANLAEHVTFVIGLNLKVDFE